MSVADELLSAVGWDALSREEQEVYRRAGYHRNFGLGRRPALLLIDMEYNFTGDVNEPILDSIAKYPDSCGPNAWESVPAIARALGHAREASIPVVFTHGTDREGPPNKPRVGNQIIDELQPNGEEMVLEKPAASAFFGTDLDHDLNGLAVDTIIHVGCTTSGCVRASVVDAAARGYRNAVVDRAVFDRAKAPHVANLFDMDAKYADVISMTTLEQYLASI